MYKHKNKAFSLFVALSLITAMSMVSLTLGGIILNSLQRTNEDQESQQAYYSARSAKKLARLELKDKGPGYESSATWSDPNMGDIFWNIKGLIDAKLTVTGSTGSDDYYTIPIKGKGDALNDCSQTSTGDLENWYHACNWYKLYPGESVAIPLYIEKNGVIYNPSDDPETYFNLSDIKIVFRSPCASADQSSNPDCPRYEIHSDFDKEIVVNWIINGTCNNEDCFAYTYKDDGTPIDDSSISGAEINVVSSDNTPLFDQNSLNSINLVNTIDVNTGQLSQPGLLEFLTDPYYGLKQAVIQMTAITGIYADDGVSSIPYFEYQIEFKSDGAFADRYESINYGAETQNFNFEDEDKEELQPNLSEFTVSL